VNKCGGDSPRRAKRTARSEFPPSTERLERHYPREGRDERKPRPERTDGVFEAKLSPVRDGADKLTRPVTALFIARRATAAVVPVARKGVPLCDGWCPPPMCVGGM
jgi:hypothetical protein